MLSVLKKNRIKTIIIISIPIILGMAVYLYSATHSGLWFDEEIEYYYSKVMFGGVPGGNGTTNMFERIRITFQPPLYNVLMYFWLLFFDSELLFRLAGIITTMAGAVGVFFAINEYLDNKLFGFIGISIHIFTYGIAYYGLECGEYNLMICFVAWTSYFYLRFLKRKEVKSLIGFFVLSCLSVLSQYGAVFIVVGMYLTILVYLIKNKDKRLFRITILLSALSMILVVLPLMILFLIPQMNSQTTFNTSHIPHFTYNAFQDYIIGFKKIVSDIFNNNLITMGVILLLVLCIIALFIERKRMVLPIITLVITYTLYFVATACSFYGHTYWEGKKDVMHSLGGRYSLFIIPFLIIILMIGLGFFVRKLIEKNRIIKIIGVAIILSFVSAYCLIGINDIGVKGWIKDDIREATIKWYHCKGTKTQTLIHPWDECGFDFYLTHDKRYRPSYKRKVDVAKYWISEAKPETIKKHLKKMGYFDLNNYYYVAPNKGNYHGNIDLFKDAVKSGGYSVDSIYNGKTVLLYVHK